MSLLDGKSVVVTGGATGIGKSIVMAMAAEGASIVINYHSHPDVAQDMVATITSHGGKAVAVQADVTSTTDIARLLQTAVDQYGKLDVLVNNAGLETRQSLLDTTEDDYDKVMNVDLKSAFFAAQAAAKIFIKQGHGGLVINVSSVHETWPMAGNIAYCIAKGGMRMLTRTAGVELGPHGIRFVNIAPGAVDTPINASTEADPETKKELDDSIPLRKQAQPDDIAGVAVFLASGMSSYLTATTITVDGGMTQAGPGL